MTTNRTSYMSFSEIQFLDSRMTLSDSRLRSQLHRKTSHHAPQQTSPCAQKQIHTIRTQLSANCVNGNVIIGRLAIATVIGLSRKAPVSESIFTVSSQCHNCHAILHTAEMSEAVKSNSEICHRLITVSYNPGDN